MHTHGAGQLELNIYEGKGQHGQAYGLTDDSPVVGASLDAGV